MFLGMRVGIPMQGAGGLWSPYSASLAALLAEASSSGLVLDFTRNIAFRSGTQSTIAGVSGWSYTRSGTAYDLAGTTSFAANTPRRTSAGLLVEAGATNLLLQSQTFDNASWGKSNVTITADAATAPDGTVTADAYINTSGNLSRDINQSAISISTATVYTLSVFIRYNSAGGLPWVELTTTDPTARRTWFNVQTGAAGTLGHTSSSITNFGNGWYRCSVTWTTAATSMQFFLSSRPADNNPGTATGDGTTPQFFIWGAQLETGSTASSYIPTTTASASRGADAASVTGIGGLTGGGQVSLIGVGSPNGSNNTFCALNNAGSYGAPQGLLLNRGSTSNVAFGGNATSANRSGTFPDGAVLRAAGAANTSGTLQRVTANGLAVVSSATLDWTGVGSNQFQIGALNSSVVQPFNGVLQLVALLPRALSDTELQNATA